jgi:hypothetical protein
MEIRSETISYSRLFSLQKIFPKNAIKKTLQLGFYKKSKSFWIGPTLNDYKKTVKTPFYALDFDALIEKDS